jgi:Fe-S-cluster containining protein
MESLLLYLIDSIDDNLFMAEISLPQMLDRVYSKIPDTKGCMENLDTCGAWCCREQTPHALKSEFGSLWESVTSKGPEYVIATVVRAVGNYLSSSLNKGCVFWDQNTKMCQEHERRPFACRTYGIMPEEEWKPRYEKLKVLNNDLRPQCGLVSTESGEEFSKEESDRLWQELLKYEPIVGVQHDGVREGPDGNYKSLHDHIVVEFFPKEVMRQLSHARISSSDEAKKSLLQTIESMLRKNLGTENGNIERSTNDERTD